MMHHHSIVTCLAEVQRFGSRCASMEQATGSTYTPVSVCAALAPMPLWRQALCRRAGISSCAAQACRAASSTPWRGRPRGNAARSSSATWAFCSSGLAGREASTVPRIREQQARHASCESSCETYSREAETSCGWLVVRVVSGRGPNPTLQHSPGRPTPRPPSLLLLKTLMWCVCAAVLGSRTHPPDFGRFVVHDARSVFARAHAMQSWCALLRGPVALPPPRTSVERASSSPQLTRALRFGGPPLG